MAASSQTTNYELPIYASGDIPSWSGDWNPAMQTIDTTMKDISDDVSGLQSTIGDANSGLVKDVADAKSAASSAQSTATSAQSTATSASTQASTNATAISGLQTKVANAITCQSDGTIKLG